MNTVDSIDAYLPQTPEARRNRRNHLIVPAGALALAGTVAFTGNVIDSALATPEFSDETATYTLQSNEGVSHAAVHIENVDEIDQRLAESYIIGMPANQDVLNDGLQLGETLIIPESVEP